jgi:hypothetical protein
MTMPVELYVYYRVAPEHADLLRARVSRAQAALRQAHPGLNARLLRRPPVDATQDHTWMEVYTATGPVEQTAPGQRDLADDPATGAVRDAPPLILDPALRDAIEAALGEALGDGLLRGPRHVEVFEPA